MREDEHGAHALANIYDKAKRQVAQTIASNMSQDEEFRDHVYDAIFETFTKSDGKDD